MFSVFICFLGLGCVCVRVPRCVEWGSSTKRFVFSKMNGQPGSREG